MREGEAERGQGQVRPQHLHLVDDGPGDHDRHDARRPRPKRRGKEDDAMNRERKRSSDLRARRRHRQGDERLRDRFQRHHRPAGDRTARQVRETAASTSWSRTPLALRAVEGLAADRAQGAVRGPTAVAFSPPTRSALAKALTEVRQGRADDLVQGRPCSTGRSSPAEQIKDHRHAARREPELIAKLLYLMQAPIRGWRRVLRRTSAISRSSSTRSPSRPGRGDTTEAEANA